MNEQEKNTNAKLMVKKLYRYYGTDSGCLFGLKPEQSSIAYAIVVAVLRIQDDEASELPYQESME